MMFSFSDISYQLTYAIQDIEKIDHFLKPRRVAEERTIKENERKGEIGYVIM